MSIVCRLEVDMGRSIQELLIFNAFLKNTSDSIVIKEYFANERGEFIGGKIVCASDTKARHYGLDMDTIRGHTDFDLMPHNQAEKAFHDDIWVMKNRQPIKDIREKITHKNGEIVTISVTKFPWFLPGGEIIGVMCIARDISIREKAKQTSHDLVEFLKQEIFHPLIPMYQNDLKNSKSGKAVKAIILRLRKKIREVL